MAFANTNRALVFNGHLVSIIARGTVRPHRIGTLTCLRVADSDPVALVFGCAGDSGAQVLTSASAATITLVVHCDWALVVALRVLRCEWVAA